jgi:2,3-bisphosphoglycerate-independent phosphoglycerate mutase
MGHQGSVERKVQAIEYLDERIVAPILKGLEKSGEDFRILVLPDHPTPICIRTHSADPVPYILYDSREEKFHTWQYNEKDAKETGVCIPEGCLLMEQFLAG